LCCEEFQSISVDLRLNSAGQAARRRADEIPVAFANFPAHSFDAMSDRQLILEAVQQMPEEASAQEILDELLLLTMVRERLEKNPHGKGVPAEELLQQVSSWATK
jgi:hypothetical protein